MLPGKCGTDTLSALQHSRRHVVERWQKAYPKKGVFYPWWRQALAPRLVSAT